MSLKAAEEAAAEASAAVSEESPKSVSESPERLTEAEAVLWNIYSPKLLNEK